jgi:hypothetical protein
VNTRFLDWGWHRPRGPGAVFNGTPRGEFMLKKLASNELGLDFFPAVVDEGRHQNNSVGQFRSHFLGGIWTYDLFS